MVNILNAVWATKVGNMKFGYLDFNTLSPYRSLEWYSRGVSYCGEIFSKDMLEW